MANTVREAVMALQIPWTRIFPDTDHRWVMGLRQGDLATYFADHDPTGAMLAERRQWFTAAPETYTALLPEGHDGVQETCELARTLGRTLPTEFSSPQRQLLELTQACEPDLVWMHPGRDGLHRLVGGAVCFPSSWSLHEMLGRPMHEVHALVPGLNAALSRQIETFLRKLHPGVPWLRENWGLSRDAQLNHHPSRPRQPLAAAITVNELWVRLEHQLLLKLPQSASVLFGIRLEVVPLAQLLADRPAALRFSRLLTTLSPEAATYKGLQTARPTLLEIIQQATTE